MIEIRRAGLADAPAVDAMVRELAAHEGSLPHVAVDATGWRAMLERPEVHVMLAEVAGETAGFVSAVRRTHLWSGGDLLALDDLYVRGEYRGAGIGGRLMTEMARLAAREGVAVSWGVRVDNFAAQRFYERLGARLQTHMTAHSSRDAIARHLETQEADA